jgi:hypothetical protein
MQGAQGVGEDEEITSPLKETGHGMAQEREKEKEKEEGKEAPVMMATRQLFQAQKEDKSTRVVLRKRKSKSTSSNSSVTPDLNLPVTDNSVLVPTGLVLARVNQIAQNGGERTLLRRS